MDIMVKLHYASIGATNEELSSLLSDAANEIIALRVEKRQLSRLIPEWQLIETAPTDTDLLLFCSNKSIYIGEGWIDRSDDKENRIWYNLEIGEIHPTYWMPLPEPPKEAE